ncbi:hypothetical protein M501DRAFT_1000402 [Patellaria atrata CBS 101060]|uniref:PhoD-like phosphatase metallophosphatase domain-containing protein n=1 Tax=Patellaria atrata CBS 101060 TaxID=1346257 RepID=A0A9P4SGA2_9PEZI|nr:hypothetical protein M501DRAFT_1000402 [Patellaria atrata CBS 101060]
MGHTLEQITGVTSIVLRFSVWVFLRWIPYSFGPKLLPTLFAAYTASLYKLLTQDQHYDITTIEIDRAETSERETNGSSPRKERRTSISIKKTVTKAELPAPEELHSWQEKLRTLLTGWPVLKSNKWNLISLGVNSALLAMAIDHTFRAPLLYHEYELSFARVGYVASHSAEILVRVPNATDIPLKLTYSVSKGIGSDHWRQGATINTPPSEETDFTQVLTLTRLADDTDYVYKTSNGHSGTFKTAPKEGHIGIAPGNSYTFLHSSCIKPRVPYNPFDHPLHIRGFQHLSKVLKEANLGARFMIFLGDFIYRDVPIRYGKDNAESFRKQYRQVYASPDWPAVTESLPWIHILDDHEIANDWDKNTTDPFAAAYDPFQLYHVAANPPAVRKNATYFQFTQGPTSFFLMDTRRYRSPERPLHDAHPAKTMLGAEQLDDLLVFLHHRNHPDVRWKIVVSSIPFTQNWRFGGEDTWGGYLAERQKILEAMWDASMDGTGVVVLSGDRHEFAAVSFPPPEGSRWSKEATVHEFSASPLSMFFLPVRTFWKMGGDEIIKYIPGGNYKFGSVSIRAPEISDQAFLDYTLFVDGKETWKYTLVAPPKPKIWEQWT